MAGYFKRYTKRDRFLDVDDHNRRADVIEAIVSSLPAGSIFENGRILTRNRPIPASAGGTTLECVRLTAYDSTNKIYTGVLQESDNTGHYSDVSPTVTYSSIFEKRDFIGIEIGARIFVQENGNWAGSTSILATGTQLYVFEFVKPREVFTVKTTKTGGSDGSATTAASWTYRVDTVDGVQLATAQSPLFPVRPAVGKVTFAPADSLATACYDDAAVLTLLMVREVPTAAAC